MLLTKYGWAIFSRLIMWENKQLIEGLQSGEREAVMEIYKQYYGRISSWVKENKGNKSDAEDLFQDAISVIFQQLQKGLQIEHQFYTYLFSICRNLWFKRLRDDRILRNGDDKALPQIVEEADTAEDDRQLKEVIFRRKFAQLGEKCRKILKLAQQGKSPDEIAEQLSLKSGRHATNRKSYCKQQLAEMVQNDPLYKELKK